MAYQLPTVREDRYANRGSSIYGQSVPQIRAQQVSEAQAALYAQGAAQASQRDSSLASIITSFGQTHLGVPGANISSTSNGLSVGTNPYFYTADGQLIYVPVAGMYTTQNLAPTQLPDSGYGNYPATLQYLPQGSYPGYMPGYPMLPYTPGRSTFYSDRSDILHKGVPGLENRRGSYSTDESAPGTPYYGPMNMRDHGTHIAAVDRSPIYSTPSPQLPIHHIGQQVSKPLPYKNVSHNVDIDALLQQQPAIPRAVPAVFTPRENMRTLEQSLSNPIFGNKNVYIRGLHPNTDDLTLAAYAARFGQVETSKAIIDTSTGACKGFGFAKYFDVRDSELCIRGFYKLGYEVGFARESFNSRLKAEGDETSTNLYVSNLPRDMTESELGAIFMDYTVSSSRILRDTQGQSRGVGFARFESRAVCEEIIKKFHGQPIGSEGLLLQVRYADTPAQKDLKKITTERRQFRTNEYNVGAYGDPTVIALSPALHSPVVPRMAQIARHLPQSRIAGSWKRESSGSADSGSTGSAAIQSTSKPAGKSSEAYGQLIEVKNMQPKASTPTLSEDGSVDEGATIHGMSPIGTRGTSVLSPAIKKS